jgi:hypothetical protein
MRYALRIGQLPHEPLWKTSPIFAMSDLMERALFSEATACVFDTGVASQLRAHGFNCLLNIVSEDFTDAGRKLPGAKKIDSGVRRLGRREIRQWR